MITVPVALGERSYDVVVGGGARRLLPEVLPPGAERVAIVTQENVELDVDVDPGVPVETFVIGDGESAKTMATVERLCRGFAQFGLARSDAVVAVGGGVVSDVAGFAAAAFHRGRRCTSTCRPRCWHRSTPPSAARPVSTFLRARTSSARSGSRPRCCATSRR